MNIINEIKRLWNWFYEKRSEVAQMDHKDAFMGKIVFEILQTSTKNEFIFIPLHSLIAIHPVDNRENTIKATKKRAKKVAQYKKELLKTKKISKEKIAEILPSATYIRAIPAPHGNYYSIEGNGRIAAFLQNFDKQDNIKLEIDVYYPKNLEKSQTDIQKLRKMYELE